ncbi:MAG: M15 family metallopeptidase [Acidimicrobiales bacterium]
MMFGLSPARSTTRIRDGATRAPAVPGRGTQTPSMGGSATLSAVAVVGVGMALFVGVGRMDLESRFGGRAQRVAAQAAAAGAADGPEAAWVEVVGRGGRLVSFELVGSDAVVTVEVAGTTATARAPVAAPDPALAGANRQGLSPDLLAAIGRADSALGGPLSITSGLRSTARQAELYANRANNPFPVAPPGMSRHETGDAIDVPLAVAGRLAALAEVVGLCQPYPRTDPVHFELCR